MVVQLDCQPFSTTTPADLRVVLRNINRQSCPLHYNFHLHTHHSDGQMSPTQILEQARQVGLQGLAITDHHTLNGYRAAHEKLENGDPYLWTGVEITALLLGCEVHILGYDFAADAKVLQPYLQGISLPDLPAQQVIADLQAAGGLAVLAHPFRYTMTGSDLVEAAVAAGIDGLEVYYGYKNSDPWIPTLAQTQLAEAMATHHDLYKTCGTDSHGLSIVRRI
ncbi:MAG: PHP domain-containing protein [Cyanobacteriota bacterium]|nr:PHP domain-containing protein [Cyanobacteriota bacterium]